MSAARGWARSTLSSAESVGISRDMVSRSARAWCRVCRLSVSNDRCAIIWSSASMSAARRWRLALACASAARISAAQARASRIHSPARSRSAGATLAGSTIAPTSPAQTIPITISSIRATATSKISPGWLTAGSATMGSV
ncbi:hypothetical protein D3C72_1704380 [compost metagenome]